ncbi:Glutamine synthetase/guanido kinase [Colletotrichum tabaci]|uniref:Glutamine synthetase n=1 Tax=Colletotrichum tabaci TaxID=1209068 RepID=A0AAV9TA87_9PEZI
MTINHAVIQCSNGGDSPGLLRMHSNQSSDHIATRDNIAELLKNDVKVKVAGVDCDGLLRGKMMAKSKFLASVDGGFAMSSAIFGWDMHDLLHVTETSITTSSEGYADFLATPDLTTFRRLPFEDNIPFFLVTFSSQGRPVSACGRSLLGSICEKLLDSRGYTALAGVELEFMNFQTPSEDGYQDHSARRNLAGYLSRHSAKNLRPLTAGMFGYSATRPVAYKEYFYQLFDGAEKLSCNIESYHTESGPGVLEVALQVSPAKEMADKVTMFKFLAKATGIEHDVTPCFMAKPVYGLPGNSGHIHLSLVDADGKNVFARDDLDTDAPWPDVASLSDLGRHFLAGILDGLEDVMVLFAPTINSYKRLVENHWAPVNVSWGLEHRLSSVRLVSPPTCKPSATRFEVRLPGADLHPHYALAAILGLGWRGVEKKLGIKVPPSGSRPSHDAATPLPNTLERALARFRAPGSVSREIFPGEFVDFFAATREHEIQLYREAVTDWEFNRYIETV